jgi:predicted dehydrogenase
VIASCDVVLLATPPHFRPAHLAAAVDAGVHVFCEKPVAVDPRGVRSVLESARQAREQGLSLVSGLCYRYQFAKRETIQRVHDGAIGDIVALETTYNTGGVWHRGRGEDWSDMEWQLRNWLYFTWLSGDHIVEQHVHSLDKVAWAMNDVPPARVTASGGRQVRTEPEYGNVFDHFNSVFEWASGVRAFSSCRQWSGADSDVSDRVYGTHGTAHLQAHRIEAGPWSWRWRGEAPDDMYQNEQDALFAAIRAGEPLDNGTYMSQSTLMGIMARMSAYTGKTVSWDEAMSSDLDLSPPAYEWGALEVRPPARPA